MSAQLTSDPSQVLPLVTNMTSDPGVSATVAPIVSTTDVSTTDPVVMSSSTNTNSITNPLPGDVVKPTSSDEDTALEVLDSVLTEVEANQQQHLTAQSDLSTQQVSVIATDPTAQVLAQGIQQVIDPSTQVQPGFGVGPTHKEQLSISPQEIASSSLQGVEIEKSPEIPADVESYLEKVQNDPQQVPQEVVISGNDVSLVPHKTMTRPVIVLPITSEVEELGHKKGTAFSIRWLVEWSEKIMKMFTGKVIYRQDDKA